MKKFMLVAAMLAMLLIAVVPAVASAQDNGNVCSVPVDVSNTGDATSNTVVVPSQDLNQNQQQVNDQALELADSDNDGDVDKLLEDLDLEDLEDLDEGVLDDLGDLLNNDGKVGDVSLSPTLSQDQSGVQGQETDVEGGDASIEVSPSVNVDCNQTVDQDAEALSY